jgi:hypothetical protein
MQPKWRGSIAFLKFFLGSLVALSISVGLCYLGHIDFFTENSYRDTSEIMLGNLGILLFFLSSAAAIVCILTCMGWVIYNLFFYRESFSSEDDNPYAERPSHIE